MQLTNPLPRAAPALLAAATLCASAGLAGAQTTWHVDDDGPGDPFPGVSIPNNPTFSDPLEDGSAAHPYDDIYKAVNAAAHGDVVLVHPSNWIGHSALTSTLDLKGKRVSRSRTAAAAPQPPRTAERRSSAAPARRSAGASSAPTPRNPARGPSRRTVAIPCSRTAASS